MAKGFPRNLTQEAHAVLEAWREISLPSTIGDITPAVLEQDIQALDANQAQLNTADAQLTDMRNKRDELTAKIWDHIKRVRAGIKANYGDDSSQYEMIGGTRTSERKSPTRKAKPA